MFAKKKNQGVSFQIIHRIIVTKENYSNSVLKMMKNVCTVDKMTPLTTHLLNALSPGHLQVMFSNGLIQLTLAGSPQQQKKLLFGIFGNSL